VRREPNRRHPILLTLLAQSSVDVRDSVVQLFDQTLSGSESRARIKLREVLAEKAKLSEDRLALLDEILPVLADAGVPDERGFAAAASTAGIPPSRWARRSRWCGSPPFWSSSGRGRTVR
jgi:hypothetical protein